MSAIKWLFSRRRLVKCTFYRKLTANSSADSEVNSLPSRFSVFRVVFKESARASLGPDSSVIEFDDKTRVSSTILTWCCLFISEEPKI